MARARLRNATLVLSTSRMPRTEWADPLVCAGPPGPAVRSKNLVLATREKPAGGPAADEGVRPTTGPDVRVGKTKEHWHSCVPRRHLPGTSAQTIGNKESAAPRFLPPETFPAGTAPRSCRRSARQSVRAPPRVSRRVQLSSLPFGTRREPSRLVGCADEPQSYVCAASHHPPRAKTQLYIPSWRTTPCLPECAAPRQD